MTDIKTLALQCRDAATAIASLPTEAKNTLLRAMAHLPGRTLHLLSRISPARRAELQALVPAGARVVFHGGVGEEQYRELLKTEGLHIEFLEDGIKRIAEIAWQVNEKTENIGARRLHTLLERLLEEVSFSAADLAGKQQGEPIRIDAAYVNEHLGELAQDEDLSRYIL